MENEKPFDAWRSLLHVGWLAVLLGLAIEVILVVLAVGFGTLKDANPVLADLVHKISWSVIVCVGIAVGAMAAKARGPLMGLAGLLAAPLAFVVARSLHKGALAALGVAAAAGPVPSLLLIGLLKGLQYASFGLALNWVEKKPGAKLVAYLATGLSVGVVFGGMILALVIQAAPQMPPVPVLVSSATNEVLFPVGCALAIYVSKVMKKVRERPSN
jgi:hypothetical protein